MSAPSTAEVLEQLEILRRKLENEGLYTREAVVVRAIEEIKRLRQIEAAANGRPKLSAWTGGV